MAQSYLLDTHTLIWFLNGDHQLSEKARAEIEDESNDKFVSVASLWEMAIKISLKKLTFSRFSGMADLISDNGFELLPIAFEHTLKVAELEFFHSDPFDRILIAQGMVEQLTILSRDNTMQKYPVEVLW
jgi:PIN domain nuclease of toxin-antitoxin system